MRLVYAALAWCTGLLAAASGSLPLLLASAGLLLALGLTSRRPRLGMALMALCLAGGLRLAIAPTAGTVSQYNDAGGLMLEGIVREPPVRREGDMVVILAADQAVLNGDSQTVSGGVRLQAAYDNRIQVGDRIRATGRLISPWTGDRTSYSETLARRGVVSLMRGASVERLAEGAPSLERLLAALRQQLIGRIDALLPEPPAGLIAGILLGDDSFISAGLRDDFAATGTAHVLAVSGFNMVIVAASVEAVLRRLRTPRFVSAAGGLGAIVLYALLTGASPAILRAALMSALVVVGAALRRRSFLPASLAFAVLVLSLINPLVLWDIGFQLSLFTALAVAQFGGPIRLRIDRALERAAGPPIARAAAVVTEPFGTTLAAQVAVVPLTALYFGTLSLAAPLTNLLIGPLQPFLLIGSAAALLADAVSPALGTIAFLPVHLGAAWTIAVVRRLADWPLAQIAIDISPRLIALYFVAWMGWSLMDAARPRWLERLTRLVRSRKLLATAAGAGALAVIVMGATAASAPDGLLHVWFLDQDGANAILIQTPGGAHLLVDGGPYPVRLLTALGDRLPFQKRMLDVMLVTQPDAANMSALPEVLARYDSRLVLTTGQPNLDDDWADFTASAGERLHVVTAGWSLNLSDGVRLEVISPDHAPSLSESLNDASLALRLTYGNVTMVLPGDLSAEEQARLADVLPSTDGVTVLQVPLPWREDGLNPAFLAAVAPDWAVLQDSAATHYDDPSPQTRSALAAIPQLSTADGTVHIWTDGAGLWHSHEA